VLTDGYQRSRRLVRKRSPTVFIPPIVVLNILARQRDPGPPVTILTPAALTLRHAPIADCARYDQPQENHLMERTQLFDLMGELKLYGMKDAFDEIMATRRQTSA